MPRIQFSLRTLLLAFIPIGLAIAALVNANYYWANAALTVTLACLGASIVGWLWCPGRGRAFWSGFAIFGCGYMLLAFGPWFDEHVGRSLISQQILERSAGLFGHQADLGPHEVSTFWQNKNFGRQAEFVSDPSYFASVGRMLHYWDYLLIGHCVFTLLSGLAGALLASRFCTRREIKGESRTVAV
jgi:hypothetical protein